MTTAKLEEIYLFRFLLQGQFTELLSNVAKKATKNTQRGRNRAQHVRDREADVEGAKNWRLVHLRRSKGKARRAEPTFWVWFRAKAPKEANGKAKGRADALAIVFL